MPMVTCSKCKKIVNDSSKKCPNCGAILRPGTVDMSDPENKKIYTVNKVLLYGGSILVVLDLLNFIKTYVGGIVLGFGIMMLGFLQLKSVKKEGAGSKTKAIIVIAMGAIVFIVGFISLYYSIF